MSGAAPQDVTEILAGVSTLYEALESMCVRNGDKYMEIMKILPKRDADHQTEALLREISRLVPSEPFVAVFGKTRAPAMLFFAPTLLLKAATLLASPQGDIDTSGEEWCAISSFLLATQSDLLASPGQRVVRVVALPDPPHMPSIKHTRAWSSILKKPLLEDVVPLPPYASHLKDVLDAANFGCAMYFIICGLVHLLQVILTAPKRIVCGSGTLGLCREIVRLLLSPTVLIYGSKEINIQVASASLLVAVRGALDMREAVGEMRQELLIEQWIISIRCWFDLATQSGNAACMQFLFPYMLSWDILLND
ncbi:hypothetical protein TraAM80_00243 [Trypanosoma rangeli]|uniref:Uncharacterized protein n=1 Tax=Trypanosoma rangeli TaxID=5698 RepID=A0A3R7KZ47_TRYRA|nr:uncharacterized protein TraAM80_00243 [Trypanosoma rangeli]RNF12527.1 hypothetical protein TraAM80_00243 [Trypanosoma rangeli]|eukprot:RNF12527.1 hypothetical protein TraAM80_00243 [Trypanosoma rangeli]